MATFMHMAQETPNPPDLTPEQRAAFEAVECRFCGTAPCWWLTSEGKAWKTDPNRENRPHPRELAPDMLIGLQEKDGAVTAKIK